MVVRRQLAELLPNQAHSFNGGSLYKNSRPQDPIMHRLRPAGMVDYFDVVAAHHGGADLSAPIAEPWSTPCSERPKLPAWNH